MPDPQPQQDQFQYISLPDGSYGKFAANADDATIRAAIQKDFPDAFQQPDSRNGFQKAFDTAAEAPKPDSFSHVMGDLGAGATRLFTPLAHPLKFLGGVGETMKAAMGDTGAQYDLGEKMVRPFVENPGGEAIAAIPQAAMAALGGGEAAAAEPGEGLAAKIPSLRPKSSPSIVPPIETQAERVAQSILPPGGIKPDLTRSLVRELPEVKEYASRTGNPLNTQAEGMKASRGLAEEGLGHFNENIARPFENERVTIPGVSKELGESASLGQIQKRISTINHLIDTGKNSQGASLDALVRSGLDQELSGLKSAYYSGLEKASGVPADQLKALREGYGSSFNLADQIESGRNARLTRTGMASQGQSNLGTPHSIWDLPERLVTALRGGPEAIADRQFASRIKSIQPQAQVRPMPMARTPSTFEMPPISDELRAKLSATEAEPPQIQPQIAKVPRPTNGPLPSVNDVPELKKNYQAAKAFEDEQNAEYHARRAANRASAGTRLKKLDQ